MNLRFTRLALMPLIALLFLELGVSSAQAQCKEIVGYYASWKQYRRNRLFVPENIDFRKYTIIEYAFYYPDENGKIQMTDPWGDSLNLKTPDNNLISRAHAVGTKVMLSLGGWTLSYTFPIVAADPSKRTAFAHSCMDMVREYEFDGIDIDWEFPGASPGNGTEGGPEDTDNFSLMIKEVRDSLDAYTAKNGGEHLLLTAAFHTVPDLADKIDWVEANKYLDYINCFGYDFYGAWGNVTNHNAPLCPPKVGAKGVNQAEGFLLLTEKYGVPAEKIILGIGFYGRSMIAKGENGLHVPSVQGAVDKANFPDDEGSPGYYFILAKSGEYEMFWDSTAKVPYMTKGKSFVSYDDPKSVEYKCRFIKHVGAAGCLIWEIEQDFVETAPGSGKILATPLIDKINDEFRFKCDVTDVEGDPDCHCGVKGIKEKRAEAEQNKN